MIEKYSPRIGVVSDDLTGAGDIGAQFADLGLEVLISVSVDDIKTPPQDTEVWIINSNSRTGSKRRAVKSVKKAFELLKQWNADYFYKKIL